MQILQTILKLSAGIGLFLFAMYLIEHSLKNMSGRNFKLFLQRVTRNSLGAVLGGAVVTALLQSSSMVSLMVLAFVGAGIFTMKNAIAVILGANLGTTLDSWMVATLGFKVNIEVIAYPAVFVGGFLLILFGRRKSLHDLSWFLLGFGLLFIGLSFMKTSMETQAFDFSKYSKMPLAFFMLSGFIITLIVQSSSVTMALTLSALYAGSVGFPSAAAIVLGSETGTTIKIILGAIGGNASKKRVVLGNFLFNIVLTIMAFIFLKSILYLITDVLGIKDPLIGLVTFSSMINLLGIIVFLPFLKPLVKFLERFFSDTDSSTTAFIGSANMNEAETSLDLFRRETEYFIHDSMLFNLELFDIGSETLRELPDFKIINDKRNFFSKSPDDKYEFLKQLQGEVQSFYLLLRVKLERDQNSQLNQLISALRSSMHSIKSMKDIQNNISNLRQSSKDFKYHYFIEHKKETEALYHQLNVLLASQNKVSFATFQEIYNTIQQNYSSSLEEFYNKAQESPVEVIDFTTMINLNRELFTSNKAMLIAVKDFLLEEKEAEDFNEISVYKT